MFRRIEEEECGGFSGVGVRGRDVGVYRFFWNVLVKSFFGKVVKFIDAV